MTRVRAGSDALLGLQCKATPSGSHPPEDGGQEEGLVNASSPASSPVILHGTKRHCGGSQFTQVPSKQQAYIIECLGAKRCRDRKETPEQDRCQPSALDLNTGLRSVIEAQGWGEGYGSSAPPERPLPPKLGSPQGSR